VVFVQSWSIEGGQVSTVSVFCFHFPFPLFPIIALFEVLRLKALQ